MKRIYDFGVPHGSREYYQLYREANRERIRLRNKAHYEANKQRYDEARRKYMASPKGITATKKREQRYRETGVAKEWSRRAWMKMKFNLTLAEFAAMLERQNGGCAICGSPDPKVKSFSNLCIDHCHDTNRVRGLLCNACNSAIGQMDHDPERLRRAADYILKHR